MKAVNLDEALRGVYIDFEGGGAVRTAFLGVLWPNEANEPEFGQYLFDEALWPMAEERNIDTDGFIEQADLTETLQELREVAEAQERLVFAYAEHEQKMIRNHLPEGELRHWWLQDQNLVNARKVAKRWKTLNHPDVKFSPREGQTTEWHSLANYRDLIGYEVPAEQGPGVVASAIGLVRKELIDSTDESLGDEARSAWKQAIMHNFHDCNGMRELVIKCATDSPRNSAESQESRRAFKALLENWTSGGD